MQSLPDSVSAYFKTEIFTEATIPDNLQKRHDTKAGTWAVICVVEGVLDYTILSDDGGVVEVMELSSERPGIVEPTVPHFITPKGAVQVYVEFHR